MNFVVFGSILLIVVFTLALFLWGEKEENDVRVVKPKISVNLLKIPTVLRDDEILRTLNDYGFEKSDLLEELGLVLTSEDGSIIRISPDTIATSLDEDSIHDVYESLKKYAEAIRLGRR